MSGPPFGLPVRALFGAAIGAVFGFVAAYYSGRLAGECDRTCVETGMGAAGRGTWVLAFVGAVGDVLAYLRQVIPVRRGPEADDREHPGSPPTAQCSATLDLAYGFCATEGSGAGS